MRLALAVFAVCWAPTLAADGVAREVLYTGAVIAADTPVPTFDKGYLVFLNEPCEIAVHGPAGKLAFTRRLTAPGSRQCSPSSAAVDTDGTVAVSIGYSGPAGYAGGIVLLDAGGTQISFIDTKRYMPSQICFDREHAIWSIGWQRDQIRNDSGDEQEYFVVRKFSKGGREAGAHLPRSLWGPKGGPGAAGRGYWTIAAASDRIGALVQAGGSQEWVEWDLNGKLLSRVRIPKQMDWGRAYTASGRLYARFPDREMKSYELRWLDPATGAWQAVTGPCAGCGLLMGADGEHLVYRERGGGPVQLLWVHSPSAP